MTNAGVLLSLSMVCFELSSLFFKEASSCTNCHGVDVTCVDGECLPRCVNVTSSGECLQCRDSRFYGKQCENDCPHSCLNSRCQLINSRVVCSEGCVPGKKGNSCGVDCPASCTQCERYGDRCTEACKSPKYYGDICNQVCPSNCNGTCDRNNGTCNRCKRGFKGRFCNDSCHTACTQCERYGYICIGNCSSALYYGDQCNKVCPTHCEDGCDKDKGECNGCKFGYPGAYCNESCSSICNRGCESGACINCTANCIGLSTRHVHPLNQLGTVWVVLLVTVFSGAIVFTSILLWRRRKRKKILKYNIVSVDVPPTEDREESIENNNSVVEWEFDNSVYEPAGGAQHKPSVKPCNELKGEQAEHHMKQEFKVLPQPEVQSSHCGHLSENYLKNRYKDILPFDNTRVCLTVEEEQSNYINASYIDGYREVQYIAAQGPTKLMMNDFWKMIWQGGVTDIVMLTNLVEDENVKCEMYWPACGIDYSTHGDVSVQCVEEKVFEHYTVRSLAVWKANCQTKMINQFHYTSWPAQGVPQEVTSLIDFYKVVKNTSSDEEGPTLVHCSAGVGRTGTFLSLVYLIEQARYEGRACVYSCVHDIRFQRMKMVHTEDQYVFLYRVLTAALETRGIVPANSAPTRLQCRLCWETDRQRPVVNGVPMVYNLLDRNQSSSYVSIRVETAPV